MPIARQDWPRLLDLVEQALDVPAAERASWLSSLELPTALADELRRLLAERRALETRGFLAALPELPELELPRAPGEMAPGTSVGPWRLVRELGQGGMSTVWLAERADSQLTRRAALKLPHAGPGQDLLGRRLLRERNILAALEHRHIARLYDVGVTEAGVPYLVMEYVEGDTLLAHADARRQTIARRIACFRQVLSAMQYAHGKLVLHRDLKPGNILVDADGDAKLLDFGIAKLLASQEAAGGATDLTQAAGRRMTLAYASPEQLRGEALGTASDVYSLGVVLYELLCGQRPFETAALSPAQLERAVLTLEPRPLGRALVDPVAAQRRATTLPALRKTLGGDLNAIVLKALARMPERRYASVEALDADLAQWLAGKPVSAHPPVAGYYFAKFVTRNRWAVGSATLALLALTVASGLALYQAREARQQAARASTVRDFLVAMFLDTDPNRPDSQPLTAKTLLENGRRRATESLTATPDLKAELLKYIGHAQVSLSDRTGADRTYAEAAETYARAGDTRAGLLVLVDRIDNELALGRVDEAEALLKVAAASSEPFRDDVAVMGTLLTYEAFVAGFRRDWAADRHFLQLWLKLADRHPGMPALDRVQVLQNLATASAHLDDLAGATARIHEAFETLDAHPEIAPWARLDVVNYRQDIDYQWGRYADIARTSPDDIRECHRLLSPHSPTCLKLELRLQLARQRLGLTDEARSLDAELEPMLDPASPRDQIAAGAAIARALARAGELATRPDLVAQLQQAAASRGAASLDANYVVVAFNALAEIQLLAGRPDEALAWVDRAEQLTMSGRAVVGAEVHRLRALKGITLEAQGRHEQALAAMAPLCSPARAPLGMARVEDLFLSLNCAPSLVASGQRDAAIVLLSDALPALRENLGEGSPAVREAQAWLDALRATGALPPTRELARTRFT